MNDDSADSGTIVVQGAEAARLPHADRLPAAGQEDSRVSGTMVRMYYPKTNEVQEKNLGKENKAAWSSS